MKPFYRMMSLFLLYPGIFVHAGEISTDPPVTDSNMLCPFKVEVYPKECQAGDIVYVRVNFENTTDHPVWAPAAQLNGPRLEHGILSYYFGDGRDFYSWKRYSLGDFVGWGAWEKILPGQKGLTQYEMIEYRRTRNLKCWDKIKTNRARRKLMVQLLFTGYTSLRSNTPVQPVIFWSSLDIRPRHPNEMELIENFMSSQKYAAMENVISNSYGKSVKNPGTNITLEEIQEIVIEMQEFCGQISQGTLKNFIQYQIFLIELTLQIRDKNTSEQMITMEKIEKWLESLPELEQVNLKIYARDIKRKFLGQDHSEKLMERFTDIFGEFPPMPNYR